MSDDCREWDDTDDFCLFPGRCIKHGPHWVSECRKVEDEDLVEREAQDVPEGRTP